MKGLVAGAVVVLGAVVAAWWLWPKGETRQDAASTKKGRIKEVTSAKGPKRDVTKRIAPKSLAPGEEKPSDGRTPRVAVSCITNFGRVTTTYRRADGSLYEEKHDIVKPIVDNGTDQLLLMAAEREPGEDAPPLPDSPGADKEFRDNLMSKPVVINEDDSEAVKAVKRRLVEMREAMIEATKDGHRFEDVMAEHQEMMASSAELRREALNGLREIVEGGNAEDAANYIEKMNAFLEERGIKKIDLPRKYRKEKGK